jgi:hypothetical protein
MKGRFALVLALGTAMMVPTATVSQSEHSQEELSDRVIDALSAGRAMPAVFGGLWLDDMVVVVAFTPESSSSDIRKVTDELPGWATYRVEEVAHSEADLTDVYEDVTDDMVAREIGFVVGVGVDLRDNLVEISVLPDSVEDTEERLREDYGRVELRLKPSEPDQGTACTRYDCWDPPFKGGLSIDGCTSTGVVFNSTPSFRLLTAGHCTQSGAGWTHDGHNIGATTSTRYQNNSECDCQVIALPDDWEGHRYLKNDNQGANFLYRKQRSAMVIGTDICQSGKMAPNRRCGELTQVNYSSYRPDDDLTLKKIAVADFAVEHGDSGGPVTSDSGDTAWGLISGIQGDGDAVFSPIEGTEIEWDYWKLCVSEDSVSEC